MISQVWVCFYLKQNLICFLEFTEENLNMQAPDEDFVSKVRCELYKLERLTAEFCKSLKAWELSIQKLHQIAQQGMEELQQRTPQPNPEGNRQQTDQAQQVQQTNPAQQGQLREPPDVHSDMSK